MRSNLATKLLIVLLVATSGPAIATDDGTWHGDGGGGSQSNAAAFCGALGAFTTQGVEAFCLVVLD